jgi:hypothetical protein
MSLGPRAVGAAHALAADYVVSRQCPDGGFCFYRTEQVNESNLADTAAGLDVLGRLGRDVPNRDAVRRFVSAFRRATQPEMLEHVDAIAQVLDPGAAAAAEWLAAVDALHLAPPPPRGSDEVSTWLARAAAVVRLGQRVGQLARWHWLAAAVGELADGGGFGAVPNLPDTLAAVQILDALGVAAPAATAEFVDRLQQPGIGFTMTPESRMGRLELVAAGVACCRALGIAVRHRDDALAFVLACQTRRGGFASAPAALPDLALTRDAVVTLLALAPP